MSLNARDILLCLAEKYKGDWDKQYAAIKAREEVSENNIQKLIGKINLGEKRSAMTIIDADYPESLKQVTRPPLTIFIRGNRNLILNLKTANAVMIASDNSLTPSGEDLIGDIVKKAFDNKVTIICTAHSLVDVVVIRQLIEKAKSDRKPLKLIVVMGKNFKHLRDDDLLFSIISLGGAVISEDPRILSDKKQECLEAYNGNHPEDAVRLAVGLCKKVCVISAVKGDQQANLSTLFALRSGLDVYVMPTSLQEAKAHNLINNCIISDGAYLLDEAILDDVFEDVSKINKEEKTKK